MITMAILTILAFVALLMKLSSGIRQKILGYDFIADIAFTGMFIWLFAGTMTISGLMISIIAGLFFSITLFLYKMCWKYQRIERRGVKLVWVQHDGPWREMFIAAYQQWA